VFEDNELIVLDKPAGLVGPSRGRQLEPARWSTR
jgi:23S rRNA-/tRNA-specific pseudouridylate synthase